MESTKDATDSRSIQQGTPEWFAARERRLTSSTYGSILGINPFSGPADVEAIFKGLSPFKGNQATRYGTYHEDVAIKEYEEKCGLRVKETGFWKNANLDPAENFLDTEITDAHRAFLADGMGGSPDGLIVGDTGETVGIIEVKCPHTSLVPKWLDKCKYYMPQLQCNMLFTDTTRCDFINWTPLGLRVWTVPRADMLAITPHEMENEELVVSERQLEHMVSRGLYDPESGRLVGYRRIMVQILFSFYQECLKPARSNEYSKAWERWEFEHRELFRLVNGANEIAMKRSRPIFEAPLKRLRISPKKVNWTSILMWQAKAEVRQCRWERFCCLVENDALPMVVNDEPLRNIPAVHALDLVKGIKMPFPSSGRHVYLDIFFGGRRRKYIDWGEDLPVPVEYGAWERQKSLPERGIVCFTIQEGDSITHGHVGTWEPRPRGDGASEVTLGAWKLVYDSGSIRSMTRI